MSTDDDTPDHGADPSQLALLKRFVSHDAWWELTKQLERTLRRRRQTPRNLVMMDFLVTEIGAQLVNGDKQATRMLADSPVWEALTLAAQRAFPDDPARRLSPTAPNLRQHQRARSAYFTDDTVGLLRRGARSEAVRAAKRVGLLDPAQGSWTHPDPAQVVAADAARIRVDGGFGDPVWVLVAGSGASRVVLDAEVVMGGDRMAHLDGGRAVAMLRSLFNELSDSLGDGLRCLACQIELTPTDIDAVMGLGVLPIVKVRSQNDDKPWHNSLGVYRFTAPDGTTDDLEVHAADGAPVVTLQDSPEVDAVIRLRRQRTRWEDTHQRHQIASSQYAIPDSADVPTHLQGATTEIPLTRTGNEAGGRPSTRRTGLLCPIPEGDPDFDHLFTICEEAIATLAVLDDGRIRGQHARLKLAAYQMLSIMRATMEGAARRDDSATPQAT